MSLPILYPYLPEGRELLYVSLDNAFMLAAKRLTEASSCRKHATGAVAVRDGQIIAQGSNAAVYVRVCPRVYKGYETGQGYRYCKEYCHQDGHAEYMTCQNAKKAGVDLQGADLYLYGHWWACQKCWDAMIGAGIKNVYLLEGSEMNFNDAAKKPGEITPTPNFQIYVSGPLTHLKDATVKDLYEKIGALAQEHGMQAHIPHQHTDPAKNADKTPEEVYQLDRSKVQESDLLICYVDEPALGVGMEIAIALELKKLVVLLSKEGTKVTRIVLGSPNIIDHVVFTNHEDALQKLSAVFKQFVFAGRKQNVSIQL